MGEPAIKNMVQAGFDGKEGPRGQSGRMLNYRQQADMYSELPPDAANIDGLLEVIGLQRAETPKGVELKKPFTQAAAFAGLRQLAETYGADARSIAQVLNRKLRGIDSLPVAVAQTAKARWDSVTNFANELEKAAIGLENGTFDADSRIKLANATQWAHFFENLDAAVRRRVGQALRGLQYNLTDNGIELISPDDKWGRLTMSDIKGETLLGQVLEAVEKGDALKLKQLATTTRIYPALALRLNEPRFLTQMHILNNFRKNNMLLSPTTWMVRNPVSGAGVAFYYGLEDLVEGSFRVGAKDGLRAAGFANRHGLNGWEMAWKNGSDYLGSGKARMGANNAIEMSEEAANAGREQMDAYLTAGFDAIKKLGPDSPVVAPIAIMNVFNAAVSKVMGGLGEKFLGWNGGYLPAFRLLNAGDEGTRSMAYAWKVNHEAYVRAVEEARKMPEFPGQQWIEARADKAAKDSLFSGVMTDEDLAKFKREQGIPDGANFGDDELRLQIFNNLNGAPRIGVDELADIGAQRANDITFTSPIKDPIIMGLNLTRNNALVAWQLPFFKTPVNSVIWTADRTIIGQMAKWAGTDWAALSRPENASKLAQYKAQMVVSAGFFTSAAALIGMGGYVGGGPLDPEENRRWRRTNTPYSFRVGGKTIPTSALRVGGIDPFDILGIYADLRTLVIEDGISHADFQAAGIGLIAVLGRLLSNKASLLNTTTILNVITNPDRGDMSDIMASQMGGIFPLSGLSALISRAGKEPLSAADKRRFISKEEMRALGKDPMYVEVIAPLLQMIQATAEKVARPLVGANAIITAPEKSDWLGSKIYRPFGVPAEALVPFAPVVMPDDKLYTWLQDAGFTTKPRPDNKLSLPAHPGETDGGDVKLTMTNEEEKVYRVHMRTVKGQANAAEILGREPKIPIDGFVNGQDLKGALRKLMNNKNYQSLLAADPESPDRRVNPAPFSARKETELYQPVQDIIDYYDKLAVMHLLTSPDPVSKGVQERWRAMVNHGNERLKKRMEDLSALKLVYH